MRKMLVGRFIHNSDKSMTVDDRVINAAEIYVKATNTFPNLALVNPKILGPYDEILIDYKEHEILILGDPRIQEDITYIGIGVDS